MLRSTIHKIFDPADGFGAIRDVWVATDPTLAHRENRWWMYLAGKVAGHQGIQLMSACLPAGAPLSASGWSLNGRSDDPSKVETLAEHRLSEPWDRLGGRHCPSYVRGFDPHRSMWVERIYYAGGAENNWGPYNIGYLEWDGFCWKEQASPVFCAQEPWERGSVYEPNMLYADGKWKMWYVAGSNQEDYLVQAFAESPDGQGDWSPRLQVFSAGDRVFDFCVYPAEHGYEAVYSRVWVADGVPPATTGLWWCHANQLSPNMDAWSEPVQILRSSPESWYGGPWRPCLQHAGPQEGWLVFFDGVYRKPSSAGFPLVFTLGCLQVEQPPRAGARPLGNGKSRPAKGGFFP